MSNRRNQDPFEPDRRQSRRRQRENTQTERHADVEPRRRRWPWIVGATLVLVGLLPNIVGWTGLHNHLIPLAISDFQGNVSIQRASIGWFQPVRLYGVEAKDLAGNSLATIEEVTTSKSLYAFLSGDDYGQIDIHKPVLFFQARADGSNLEDAISGYIANAQPSPLKSTRPETSSTTSLPKMLVRVHEGAARIEKEGSGRVWQIDSLEASAAISGSKAPLASTAQFRATTFSPDDNGLMAVAESGTVWLNAVVDEGAKDLVFSAANVSVESDKFPLSIVAPLTQRLIGQATIEGAASAKVNAAWNAKTNEVATKIDLLQLTQPKLYAPQVLSDDTLHVQQLTAHGTLQLSPARIFAEKFIVETDFGHIDANGQFDPAQIAEISKGGQLPNSTLQMEGEIDVATLLQRLPSTFQLHKDLTLESGKIRFTAGQRNDADARRLIVNVDTANVRAVRGGQPIVWQQPLRVVGVLRESGGKLSIESLECISDFLNINGNATLREGMFRVGGDLGELSKRIRQFADLGPIQFGGTLDGQFGWQVVGDKEVDVAGLVNQPFQMGGEFTIKQPVIEMPDIPRWSPNQVVIRTSGAGQLSSTEANSMLKLDQAGAQLVVGSETSVMSLARPVEDAFTNHQWIFNTQITGELAGWLGHLRNFVDPGEFDAGGTLNFAGVTVVEPDRIRIEQGQYEVKQLGFVGYGANVREDRVVGEVTADYSLVSGDVGVQQATLQGSGISASAQNLKLTMSDAMQLAGSAAWRADINRIAEWFSLSTSADSVNWFGAAEGMVEFANSPEGTDATFRGNLTDVVATQRINPAGQTQQTMQLASNRQSWVELWREGRVNLNGRLSLGSDFDSLQLHQLSTRSSSIDFDTKGVASDLSGVMNLNLEGSWKPNFNRINALLAAYSYNTVQLSGSSIQPFRISGPLFASSPSGSWISDQLEVQTVVGWDKGQLLGLPIGQGDLSVDLRQQIATAQTVGNGITVSGGVVTLQPQLDLRSDSPQLVHGEGRLIDQVQVTPEICRDCLKFVAPWLSDTTNAQGIITADLQGMNMPLLDPMKVSARGTLMMQDVTIAAGPMASQLLDTVTQIQAVLKPDSRERKLKTWLRVEQQSIPLAVENGRVYHEGIKFSHDDLVIRTSGSVGFDQTINLVAKIPIADEWVEGNRYLESLRGQSISIPIGGTVDRPKVDRNAVQRLSSDLVRNAAQGAFNDAITDKVNPKINQFQNELSGKVNGEVNKIQNKLSGFLQDKLGLPPTNQGQPNQDNPSQQLENRLNNELGKGLNKLFGG